MSRLNEQRDRETQALPVPPDPRDLQAAQSVAGAVTAGVVAAALSCALWALVTVATDRVFPWFSILQGAAIGAAVRRYGHGFDVRFPLIAACLSCTAALIGNLVIALPETAEQLDATALQVLRGLTWRSFDIFFDEVITAVDYIYAGFAALLAAFYSRRRLTRQEVYALRTMRQPDRRE